MFCKNGSEIEEGKQQGKICLLWSYIKGNLVN